MHVVDTTLKGFEKLQFQQLSGGDLFVLCGAPYIKLCESDATVKANAVQVVTGMLVSVPATTECEMADGTLSYSLIASKGGNK